MALQVLFRLIYFSTSGKRDFENVWRVQPAPDRSPVNNSVRVSVRQKQLESFGKGLPGYSCQPLDAVGVAS